MMETISFWHWWVFAIVLIILEVFVAGTFFLWMGVAAAVVGVVLLVAPDLGWQYQWLIFATLSVAVIALWRRREKRRPTVTDQPALNRRGEQYIGRVFVLSEAITNGIGKVRADDTIWRVMGTDSPAGARVRVTGVDGTLLRVEPAPAETAGR